MARWLQNYIYLKPFWIAIPLLVVQMDLATNSFFVVESGSSPTSERAKDSMQIFHKSAKNVSQKLKMSIWASLRPICNIAIILLGKLSIYGCQAQCSKFLELQIEIVVLVVGNLLLEPKIMKMSFWISLTLMMSISSICFIPFNLFHTFHAPLTNSNFSLGHNQWTLFNIPKMSIISLETSWLLCPVPED